MATAPFGLTPARLSRVLESACRAPSLLNSQPWAFLVTDEHIEVRVDPERILRRADPDRRQAVMACGAVLLDLRLALARVGVEASVALLPDGAEGPLAVVGSTGPTMMGRRAAEMERAIGHRHSNRQPFSASEVPLHQQQLLARAAEAEGGSLGLVTDPGWLALLRGWASDAHSARMLDPAWVAEWRAWTARPPAAHGALQYASGPHAIRWGSARPSSGRADDGSESDQHPLVAVLMTDHDDDRSHITAGQAMQAVLLTATGLGLAACSLPDLIEVPAIRASIQQLLGRGFAQAALRIGFDGPGHTTGRRPVSDTLIHPSDFSTGPGH